MKKTHKFAIAGAVIFLTIVALIYTAFKQSSVYYMTVPELKSKGESVVGQGLRASGQVKDGTISYDSEKLILNFDIFETGAPREARCNDRFRTLFPGNLILCFSLCGFCISLRCP